MSTRKLSPQKNSTLGTHHAFRMVCRSEADFAVVRARIVNMYVEMGKEVDEWHRCYETLGVDDVREINDRVRDGAREGSVRLIVLFFARATIEAQNALLKTIEEPPERSVVVLSVPSPDGLLPTIISRTMRLDVPGGTESPQAGGWSSMWALSKAKRLDCLKDVLEEKRVSEARAIVGSGIEYIDVLVSEKKLSKKDAVLIQSRLLMLDTELEHGANMLKLILEAAVLLVP